MGPLLTDNKMQVNTMLSGFVDGVIPRSNIIRVIVILLRFTVEMDL